MSPKTSYFGHRHDWSLWNHRFKINQGGEKGGAGSTPEKEEKIN